MNVELKKHPREGLKWAVAQFLVSKDRGWRRETSQGMLSVMQVFKDLGLIDEEEWNIWRWVLDAASASEDGRPIPTRCPGCMNRFIRFRCDKCRRALVFHEDCLPEMRIDGRVLNEGDQRGEFWCNACIKGTK